VPKIYEHDLPDFPNPIVGPFLVRLPVLYEPPRVPTNHNIGLNQLYLLLNGRFVSPSVAFNIFGCGCGGGLAFALLDVHDGTGPQSLYRLGHPPSVRWVSPLFSYGEVPKRTGLTMVSILAAISSAGMRLGV
jgi:hypothetical protein